MGSEVARVAWKNIKKHWGLLLLLALTCIGLALLETRAARLFERIDTLAYIIFVLRLRTAPVTDIMTGFSSLASPVVLVVMLIVVVAFAPGRRPGWCALTNLLLVVGLNLLLKNILQRPRPEGYRLVEETGYSFPSGHSMASMAFYGLLIWMVWQYEQDEKIRDRCCIAFAFIILMVGLSRIYLGVHYATDVFAGFLVSMMWLFFFTRTIAPAMMDEELEPPAIMRD